MKNNLKNKNNKKV